MEKLIATNETIKNIVNSEIKILGNKADLNHIDVSEVKDMLKLFNESNFNGDISNWDVSKVKNIWMECSKSPNLMAISPSGRYAQRRIWQICINQTEKRKESGLKSFKSE